MSTELQIVIWLLFIHWFADFFMQSHKMASNKSKSWKWLSAHVLVYTVFFVVTLNPVFVILNGLIHFVVDAVTSRITSRLYKKGDYHNFFVVVGIDQFIHATTLILLANWLLFNAH